MRAVIQRVASAAVAIGDETVASIGTGLLVLLGIEDGDEAGDIDWLVPKIAKMRIFPDDAGLMNRSLADHGGEVIVVSQFIIHQDGELFVNFIGHVVTPAVCNVSTTIRLLNR